MSYNTFTSASIGTKSIDTFRSTTHEYKMGFAGLRPNTKHKMYLDEEDYTWACRGWGQNLGEDILSDENGVVRVLVYYEIPFSSPAAYEINETQSIAYASNRLGKQNSRMEDVVAVQWKTWHLKSMDGLSEALFQMHFHIPLIGEDYNKIEQHD